MGKSFQDWIAEGEGLYTAAMNEYKNIEEQMEQLAQQLATKKVEVNQIASVIGRQVVDGRGQPIQSGRDGWSSRISRGCRFQAPSPTPATASLARCPVSRCVADSLNQRCRPGSRRTGRHLFGLIVVETIVVYRYNKVVAAARQDARSTRIAGVLGRPGRDRRLKGAFYG